MRLSGDAKLGEPLDTGGYVHAVANDITGFLRHNGVSLGHAPFYLVLAERCLYIVRMAGRRI